MKSKIWHAINPTFGLSDLSFPADYEVVAEVDTDNRDMAFQLTNSIHCGWWENEGVTALKRTRSTSVGDVIEINGRLHRVEGMGWTEFPSEP